MVETIVAILSLQACVLALVAQLFSFARKDAHEAAAGRAAMHSAIQLINWRLERIEQNIFTTEANTDEH